jgi:hypothetical protein
MTRIQLCTDLLSFVFFNYLSDTVTTLNNFVVDITI